MPIATDPLSVRTRLVSEQLLPRIGTERGVYFWAGVSVTLPSGRTSLPSLVAYPAPSGPAAVGHAAGTAILIVDVVADDADLDELESLRAEYQTLPALGDYVRVGLTRRAVVVYSRADAWQRRAFTRGLAPLSGIGVSIDVARVYR